MALVGAVAFVTELLHCFASAARLELEEAGGDEAGAREEDALGWRYLPAVCVLLEWMRLHSQYMQLRDEEAATALWTDIVRLVRHKPCPVVSLPRLATCP